MKINATTRKSMGSMRLFRRKKKKKKRIKFSPFPSPVFLYSCNFALHPSTPFPYERANPLIFPLCPRIKVLFGEQSSRPVSNDYRWLARYVRQMPECTLATWIAWNARVSRELKGTSSSPSIENHPSRALTYPPRITTNLFLRERRVESGEHEHSNLLNGRQLIKCVVRRAWVYRRESFIPPLPPPSLFPPLSGNRRWSAWN